MDPAGGAGSPMRVSEAVARRHSVRSFRPDPVAIDTVREILTAAQQSPSGGNLQPWRVHVVSGEPLAELKRRATSGEHRGEAPGYDIYPPNLWEPYRTRRFQCGEDLYASIGIERDDRKGRINQFLRNAELFGAPVGLFCCIDRKLGPPQWADLGMYLQTVMLLAVERGLDTCAQEFWSAYPALLADHLGIPDTDMVFCGMALGYRDDEHPINGWRTRRDPLDRVVTFHG